MHFSSMICPRDGTDPGPDLIFRPASLIDLNSGLKPLSVIGVTCASTIEIEIFISMNLERTAIEFRWSPSVGLIC